MFIIIFIRFIEVIRYMFNDCFSLTSLNLSNFNSPSLYNSSGVFNNCKNLAYLDISNMITTKDMSYMFYNCLSLRSLNIAKFDTSQVTNMEYMFFGCSNLTYIDMKTAVFKDNVELKNMFDNYINNIIIFINDTKSFSKIKFNDYLKI